MLESKNSDLGILEESLGPERVRMLVQEASTRGTEQYGAQTVKGLIDGSILAPGELHLLTVGQTPGPSKASVLAVLKKAEDDEVIADSGNGSNPIGEKVRQSKTLFLSNALEIEDLQYVPHSLSSKPI